NIDFAADDDQAKSILVVDPRNENAIKFRAANAEMKRLWEGKMPDEATLSKLPEAHHTTVQANTFVQNAKVMYEAGKLDDAETNLTQAIKLDPSNKAAFYYLNLVRERRHRAENLAREGKSAQWMLEVDKAWRGDDQKREALPWPNSYARTNLVHTSKLREVLFYKLDHIRLDQLQYDGLPLSEVIKSLNDEAKKRDP